MKWILLILLIAGVVLVAGCTTPAPVTTPGTTAATPSPTVTATPAAPAVPDLLGNWSGTSTGYMNQSGYKPFNDTLRMWVTSQDGHLFKGVLAFPKLDGTFQEKEFAGVIGDDGKSVKIIEYPGGFSDGMILSADEMELIFRDQSSPSTICIDSLRRSTAGAAAPPVIPAMPVMLGHWNGTSLGLSEQSGYQVTRDIMTMNVTSQDGRLFTGTVSFMLNAKLVTKDFAAIFDRDGKTFKSIEMPDGFSNGVVLSANEVELTFRDNDDPSRIAIDTFVRSGATITPAGTVPAQLTGTWAGTSVGYMMQAGQGYDMIKGVMTMNITWQDNRLFKGQVFYVVNGTNVTKEVAGVFGRDGKTLAAVEFPEGFDDGIVVSGNEFQMVFRDDGTPSTIAVDTFRRVGKA